MKYFCMIGFYMFTTFVYAQEKQEKQEKNNNNEVANERVSAEKMYIDIRTSEEFSEGTIPHALNIDYYADDFSDKMQQFDKDQELIIFCKSGGKSSEALILLKDLGFKNVEEYEGGYDAFLEEASK